jgi:hypothetical protein
MEPGEIPDCIVTRCDDREFRVRCGEFTGDVDSGSIAWKPEDFPALGDRVNAFVRFLTPDTEVPFDFVGSIKDAYPEKPPINFVDDSIIGSRFVSRARMIGRWIAFRHPTGLPALLPREEWKRASIDYSEEIEAEVIGVDRKRKWLLVRLPEG